MKTRQRLTQVLGLALLMTLTACGISGTRATPTPSRLPTQVGTSTVVPPTAPATDVPATLPATAPRLAVLGTDNTTVSFVDPMVPDTRNARIGGVLPRGGTAGDTVYFLDYFTRTSVVAVDATGRRTLDFIQNPNYGLDVWPGDGDGPRLGWGVQPSGEQQTTQLFIGKPDGSEVQSVLQEAVSGDRPSHLVFERWASDGGSFYFSREPLGIGGYIPFAGASSLYRFDLATSSTTELIPFSMDGAGLVCIDDFYG
ncbi:MAG: hypothetical protein ACRDH2_18290, partial [Anaerolineales bacterium]